MVKRQRHVDLFIQTRYNNDTKLSIEILGGKPFVSYRDNSQRVFLLLYAALAKGFLRHPAPRFFLVRLEATGQVERVLLICSSRFFAKILQRHFYRPGKRAVGGLEDGKQALFDAAIDFLLIRTPRSALFSMSAYWRATRAAAAGAGEEP